ncbi:MAG: phosphoenolpyruvate carboxykinase (ATP) [Candidatus Adiutrix sp.]|jgi:phosphoenolpyruvate carboxykinase (ATP)|nr:phosphoenolpyruvate carboxykinase (ATP) [Candidatus Adiutrix sp.]
MSSQPSWKHYPSLSRMSPVRAIAESLFNTKNKGRSPREVSPAEAYDLACRLPWVTVTDLPMDKGRAALLGLDESARVIVDNNGAIVGRSATARVFYNRLSKNQKDACEAILREGVYSLARNHDLIIGRGVVGLDPALQFKASLIAAEDDAANLFFWFANFTPLAAAPSYQTSIEHPVQDILFVSYPDWKAPDNCPWGKALVVVDEIHNTIFNFGLRYFGERKKGTLTLAWTGAQRMGHVSAHGGIKEVDFSGCADFADRGRQVIAFYGLSGSGKSSHTNSLDNAGTLPRGARRRIAHDDAFQIDVDNKLCYVWEPTLFDKTDNRELGHPDWEYCVGVMNNMAVEVDGRILPYGKDARNSNGRAIFSRELLGETTDRIGFPNSIGWLMKDDALPPIVKIAGTDLAVALGATLMTKRTSAENITPDEMKKLVFEPFANPFRVYPLYEDCFGYAKVFESGCECYVWSGGGGGWWDGDDQKSKPVGLTASLTLQTAILTGSLEWEPWDLAAGAWLPTRATVDKILPGYYDAFNPDLAPNRAEYLVTLADRFAQRIAYLENSDIRERPELLSRLVAALKINV